MWETSRGAAECMLHGEGYTTCASAGKVGRLPAMDIAGIVIPFVQDKACSSVRSALSHMKMHLSLSPIPLLTSVVQIILALVLL